MARGHNLFTRGVEVSEERVVEFAADYTDEELVEYWVWLRFGQPGQKEQAKKRKLAAQVFITVGGAAVGVIGLSLVVIISRGLQSKEDAFGTLGMVLLISGGSFYVAWWIYQRASEKHMRSLWKKLIARMKADFPDQAVAMRPRGRFLLDSNGICYSEDGTSTRIEWTAVGHLQEMEFGVGVFTRKSSMFVPRSGLVKGFGGDGYSAMSELASRYRRTDEQILLKHLESNFVPCTGCQYNLKGVAEPRCPECGMALNRASLSMAFEVGRKM